MFKVVHQAKRTPETREGLEERLAAALCVTDERKAGVRGKNARAVGGQRQKPIRGAAQRITDSRRRLQSIVPNKWWRKVAVGYLQVYRT